MGIRLGFYSLRRTGATMIAKLDYEDTIAAAYRSHADGSMPRHYVNRDDLQGRLDAAVECPEQYLGCQAQLEMSGVCG